GVAHACYLLWVSYPGGCGIDRPTVLGRDVAAHGKCPVGASSRVSQFGLQALLGGPSIAWHDHRLRAASVEGTISWPHGVPGARTGSEIRRRSWYSCGVHRCL